MNTLNIFPAALRESYIQYAGLIGIGDAQRHHLKSLIVSVVFSIVIAVGLWMIMKFNPAYMAVIFLITVFVLQAFLF